MLQSNDDAVPAPVIKLSNDGTITAIHKLGVNGGVDLTESDPNPKPESLQGTYLLLPNVSGPLQIIILEASH